MINVENLYDAVIVGGGPSGLTAAIYLARARYRVLVVEKEHFGGQITITSDVVNYPGIEKTSGTELTEAMRKQAQNFGAEFLLAEVENLDLDGDIKKVKTNKGTLECFSVLIATGARPRMIGFKGEAEFKGHGVAYCATCDGEFFTGMDVFVIGGGYAAAEESVFLTKYAKNVTILIKGEDFTCAKATADLARNHEKIKVITNVEVEEVAGDSSLNYLRYKDIINGDVTEYRPEDGTSFGVFVFAGYEPATDLVKGIAEIDAGGYIITNNKQETSVKGLYGAGDVCVKPLRQVVTATGDGALAATEMEKYIADMQKKLDLHPKQPVTRVAKNEKEKVDSKPSSSNQLLTDDMKEQLSQMFDKMQNNIELRLYLDSSNISNELKMYMTSLSELTDKITVKEVADTSDEQHLPCVKIYKDNEWSGLAFHGVPGGHEFTSFVLGLYNVSGPGQSIDAQVLEGLRKIDKKIDIKILISLSCTMCPDLVVSAQRAAAENKNITAEIFDLNHYEDLKDKYKVMSVPCMIINEDGVYFGKKSTGQLLDIINK